MHWIHLLLQAASIFGEGSCFASFPETDPEINTEVSEIENSNVSEFLYLRGIAHVVKSLWRSAENLLRHLIQVINISSIQKCKYLDPPLNL